MTLYAIRHGETEWNAAGKIQGSTHAPRLTERGREQAAELGRLLAGKEIDLIVSSDLARAVETAEIVADILDRRIDRQSPDFREGSFGECEGITFTEAGAKYPGYFSGIEFPAGSLPIPGAETREALYERIENAIAKLRAEFPHQSILFVGHAGVIRMLDRLHRGQSPKTDSALGDLSVRQIFKFSL